MTLSPAQTGPASSGLTRTPSGTGRPNDAHAADFQPGEREPAGQLGHGQIGIDVFAQPGQRDFHRPAAPKQRGLERVSLRLPAE